MAKSLVIVESPAKAKTIGKYLGKQYVVKASLGHVKDLPKKDLSVDVDKGFEPHYEVIEGKKKLIAELKAAAKGMESVYLAADPDREGEAICFHLQEELQDRKNGPKFYRVMFNEITKNAIQKAFETPLSVNLHLVDAQQARRVLDRLVGYKISPLLWDKVRRGLSAGRVQTVALRLIVEREREINAFKPVENWTIDALLTPDATGIEFKARFTGIDGKRATVANGVDKEGKPQVLANALPDKASTDAVVKALEHAKWSVKSVEKKERRQNPKAPYITSKLQQDAAGRLGFNVRRTMGVAQRLYEGIDIKGETVGLITYMRTDSTRVSDESKEMARAYIAKLGPQYLPATPNSYKGKNDAQDAHEAIRPTNVAFVPDEIRQYLSEEQYK